MLNELKELQRKKTEAAAKVLLQKAAVALTKNLQEAISLIHNAFKRNKDFVLPHARQMALEQIKQKNLKSAINLGNVILKHCPGEYELANNIGNMARQNGKLKTARIFYQQAYQAKKTFEPAYLNLGACEAGVNLYDEKVKQAIDPFVRSGRFLIPKVNYFQDPATLDRIYEKVCHIDALLKVEDIQLQVFEHNIEEQDQQFQKLDDKVESIRQQLAEEMTEGSYAQKLDVILNKVETFDWNFLDKREKNTLKWEIYHHAINYLSSQKIYLNGEGKGDGLIPTQQLEFIRQLLLTLKVERCQLYYLDMLVAIISYIEGKTDDTEEIFKRLLESDTDNRFYNINFGLIGFNSNHKRTGIKHLLIGWKNIRQLDGKYQISDLIKLAVQKQEQQDFQKAMRLYHLIIRETDDPKVLQRMGSTLLNLEAWDEAVEVFQNILTLDSDNRFAREHLDKIYTVFIEKTDEVLEKKQYRNALNYLKKAISIRKTIANMKQLASIYKTLGNNTEYTNCQNEINRLELEAYRKENEKKWKAVVIKAKRLMAEKKYTHAFKLYESSFEIKPDKKTYIYLCKVYQKMKYFKALEKLNEKWHMLYRHQIRD